MGTDKEESTFEVCINGEWTEITPNDFIKVYSSEEIRIKRYLAAIPEEGRILCYEDVDDVVIAIARTPYSKVKYYDKGWFDTFGELRPVEPLMEVKWEEMCDVAYARESWEERLYGRTVD